MALKCIGTRIAKLDTRTAKPPPKTADPYYLTPVHQAWRAEVLRRASFRCQHVDRDGRRCEKAAPRHRMFADHVKERRDGGDPLDPANGKCLCGQHHTLKTAEERRRRMAMG